MTHPAVYYYHDFILLARSPVHIMWGESCSREDRLILNGITYSTRVVTVMSNDNMVQPKYQFSHLKQWCLKRQCVTFAKDFTFFDGMHLALYSARL